MKSAKENLFDTLVGRKILFLENDNGLYHGLDDLEDFLKEKNLKYKCMFEVSETPWSKIKKAIDSSNVIVFQTQWVYEVSKKIKEYAFSLKTPKIFIEVPVGRDPSFYYKPEGIAHDIYFLRVGLFSDEDWQFYKLSNKPYWDYENKFDK